MLKLPKIMAKKMCDKKVRSGGISISSQNFRAVVAIAMKATKNFSQKQDLYSKAKRE
jgi:hypothetical protein